MILRPYATKFDVSSHRSPRANANLKHIFSHAQNRPLIAPNLHLETAHVEDRNTCNFTSHSLASPRAR